MGQSVSAMIIRGGFGTVCDYGIRAILALVHLGKHPSHSEVGGGGGAKGWPDLRLGWGGGGGRQEDGIAMLFFFPITFIGLNQKSNAPKPPYLRHCLHIIFVL